MVVRKGKFVGFWCSEGLKRKLQEAAQKDFRDMSKEIVKRLTESFEERKTEEKAGVQR
jgi:hypothetical protein